MDNKLRVKTELAIYEFCFSEVQFEITGRCNMNCEHCRGASLDRNTDLPKETIFTIVDFVRDYSPDFKEVTISGGEPFMHPDFEKILLGLHQRKVTHLTITTNGSFITKDFINFIASIPFKRVTFSISLDSLNAKEHNTFRHNQNAYNFAINAMNLLVNKRKSNFYISMRSTIMPGKINIMEEFVEHAINIGVDRISFSSVLPSGKAIGNQSLLMNGKELKDFCEELQRLYLKYGDKIHISSNEPLKWQSRNGVPEQRHDEMLIDCCPAGTVSFNVNPNGDVTPCSLLDVKMFNAIGKNKEELKNEYINNEIVKELFDRNIHGKCGKCKFKISCAGCRVRALNLKGDYLSEDPLCMGGPY